MSNTSQCQQASLLSEAHRAVLAKERIDFAAIKRRDYQTVQNLADFQQYGFSPDQCRSGILGKLFDTDSNHCGYVLRPDNPRLVNGRLLIEESPATAQPSLDVNPICAYLLDVVENSLFVVDSTFDSDVLTYQEGKVTISLTGAATGSTSAGDVVSCQDEWDRIWLTERSVYRLLDPRTSTTTRPCGPDAVSLYLLGRCADVRTITIPPDRHGSPQSLVDYLAGGGTSRKLIKQSTPVDKSLLSLPTVGHFREVDGSLCEVRHSGRGEKPVERNEPLCSFTAKILREYRVTDDVQEHRELLIDVRLLGQRRLLRLTALEFEQMDWIPTKLGANAIVAPGMVTRDRLRAGIKQLSTPIPYAETRTDLGWFMHGRVWCYAHAGGILRSPKTGHGYRIVDDESEFVTYETILADRQAEEAESPAGRPLDTPSLNSTNDRPGNKRTCSTVDPAASDIRPSRPPPRATFPVDVRLAQGQGQRAFWAV